jgi:H+/Cl- antiporter ClcA
MDTKATSTANAAPNIKVAATTRRLRRVWPWMLLLLIVAGVVGYTYASLNWAYSDGERVGVLQKLSRKGWVCKTWEGELALYVVSGVAPQIWPFTVRDDQVAKNLNVSLGKRVRLHYDEHRGIPSNCFGDTQYFVDSGAEALP